MLVMMKIAQGWLDFVHDFSDASGEDDARCHIFANAWQPERILLSRGSGLGSSNAGQVLRCFTLAHAGGLCSCFALTCVMARACSCDG